MGHVRYQQLSFLVEAGRYRHRHTGGFCNIRVLIVAWFLDYLRLSFPPTARLSFRALSLTRRLSARSDRVLKQNEGDARRALKDNDYEA